MPKEIPILFSKAMVQAIDEGIKTQTRRIVKVTVDPRATVFEPSNGWPKQGDWIAKFMYSPDELFEVTNVFRCPYGKSGDLFWVRETWAKCFNDEEVTPSEKQSSIPWPLNPKMRVVFKATSDEDAHPDHPEWGKKRWRPSIHMPKDVARIWLENKGVTVERLLDISDEDCRKEGVIFDKDSGYYFVRGTDIIAQSYYEAFQKLWIKVNGEDSWISNPWVWVVNFEKINHKNHAI